MMEYTVSKSILILDAIFSPFRLDTSKEEITFLVSSRSDDNNQYSSEATEYALNNALLPSIIIALWILSISIIVIMKRCKCFRRCQWGLGGRPPAYRDYSEDADLVTIISNEDVWVRGEIEDKVRYEYLCKQMRKTRRSFCVLVVITVILSIPAMLTSLYLKDTHDVIIRDADHMGYRLKAAGDSMGFMLSQRSNLLEINAETSAQLGSSEFQACLTEDFISQASIDLADSMEKMADRMDEVEMQQQQQIFDDGKLFSTGVERNLRYLSYAMWILITSIFLLDVAAILLFLGTSIAKRNLQKKPWHHSLFQLIAYPLLICASMMLLLAFVALWLAGITAVDFCSDEGGPSITIQSILDAGDYRDSNFRDRATMYMMVSNMLDFCYALFSFLSKLKLLQNDCSTLDTVKYMHSSFIELVVEVEKFTTLFPFLSETCAGYAPLMKHFQDLSIATYELISYSYTASYTSQCKEVNTWYTNVAFEETCRHGPTHLAYSLLFILFLLFFSVVMIALSISWKPNSQLFLEVSFVVENDDNGGVATDGNTCIGEGKHERMGKTKQTSSRVRVDSARDLQFSNGEDFWINSCGSQTKSEMHTMTDKQELSRTERPAEHFEDLFLNQKREDVKQDVSQIIRQASELTSANDGLDIEDIQTKPEIRKAVGNVQYQDNPQEHGDVEITLRNSESRGGRFHRTLWTDADGKDTSGHLYLFEGQNSLHDGNIALAKEERRSERPNSLHDDNSALVKEERRIRTQEEQLSLNSIECPSKSSNPIAHGDPTLQKPGLAHNSMFHHPDYMNTAMLNHQHKYPQYDTLLDAAGLATMENVEQDNPLNEYVSSLQDDFIPRYCDDMNQENFVIAPEANDANIHDRCNPPNILHDPYSPHNFDQNESELFFDADVRGVYSTCIDEETQVFGHQRGHPYQMPDSTGYWNPVHSAPMYAQHMDTGGFEPQFWQGQNHVINDAHIPSWDRVAPPMQFGSVEDRTYQQPAYYEQYATMPNENSGFELRREALLTPKVVNQERRQASKSNKSKTQPRRRSRSRRRKKSSRRRSIKHQRNLQNISDEESISTRENPKTFKEDRKNAQQKQDIKDKNDFPLKDHKDREVDASLPLSTFASSLNPAIKEELKLCEVKRKGPPKPESPREEPSKQIKPMLSKEKKTQRKENAESKSNDKRWVGGKRHNSKLSERSEYSSSSSSEKSLYYSSSSGSTDDYSYSDYTSSSSYTSYDSRYRRASRRRSKSRSRRNISRRQNKSSRSRNRRR